MANDKDFVVNGPVAVGKDTKVTVGSISAGAVDLSTGNYFTDSPSGDYTYTFANPGDVQSFQIQATGASEAVAETFSTTLYEGQGGSTTTITNNIDLLGDGGLVWIKARNAAESHGLFDTERGVTKLLSSNNTNAETTNSGTLTDFYSNGFKVDGNGIVGSSTDPYVSWTFKKQTKFFDVVTWSGNGTSGRTVSHNLASVPGMIVVKNLTTGGSGFSDWRVWHRSESGKTATLNTTAAFSTTDAASKFGNGSSVVQPTSTEFTVAADYDVNRSGETYVAYLFAHDTASDGLIQCGSYTGNGSTTGPEINLGWQPQWLLIKGTTAGNDWNLLDNKRGTINKHLYANDAAIEYDTDAIEATATGFKLVQSYGAWNASGQTYIYMAIRSAAAPAITWPTNIEWTGGSTPSTPAEGETDVYTFTTDDGGTTYTGIQSIDNAS